MLARIHSIALTGIDGRPCEIEVEVTRDAAAVPTIAGLPDSTAKESLDRIMKAVTHSGYLPPKTRATVTFAPADARKDGAAFDLPIALGLLLADEQIRCDQIGHFAVVGELAPDGRVRPIRGALSLALSAREHGFRGLLVPGENAVEAALVEGLRVYAVETLREAASFLAGLVALEPIIADGEQLFAGASSYDVDFSDVRGQEHVKRALLIAVAGGHNALLIGPPGAGKTMLAKRLPTICPPMTFQEAVDVTRIHSAAGQLKAGESIVARRPVRQPHHSTSVPALIGGGTIAGPGEVSLANEGVLFLDELPEFTHSALEAVRQVMDDGAVTVTRTHGTVRLPAHFVLAAAMAPCPCGYFTDPGKPCTCSAPQIDRYLARVSGPVLERIDVQMEVPAVPIDAFRTLKPGTDSATMRAQVQNCRDVQRRRFGEDTTTTNGRMSSRQLRKFTVLDADGERILRHAVSELGLSARAHDKVLRVARTIADMYGEERIQAVHISEAVNYRRLDRNL